MRIRYTATLILLSLLPWTASVSWTQVPPDSVSKGKRTVLDKYLLAVQAYEKWKANQQGIKILDVRTLGEYVYVGHAPMACHIPFKRLSDRWDPARGGYSMPLNPGFAEAVKELFSPADTVMVMCRSGGRSAAAVNLMAGEGFRNVYNIIDGFEGDKVTDPDSYFLGKRVKNGWKNSGAPWTYDLDPKLVYKK